MIKEEEKHDAKTVIDDPTKGNKNLLQDPNQIEEIDEEREDEDYHNNEYEKK